MAQFNSKEFIADLARDLITSFAKAKRATTSGLKGAASEKEIRQNLEYVLPNGVGVGTGCVIDSKGNVSKQQDIIIYEKEICPKFSINNTSESTYYPCEGVIAVGEIKTSIGKKELFDSFSKVESVKSLKRQTSKTINLKQEEINKPRYYLSRHGFSSTKKNEFNQIKNANDQIFGFILCADFNMKNDTLSGHITTLCESVNLDLLPNILISLEGTIIVPYSIANQSIVLTAKKGDSYVFGINPEGGSFEYLLASLYKAVKNGRTVPISAFEYYIITSPDEMKLTPTGLAFLSIRQQQQMMQQLLNK